MTDKFVVYTSEGDLTPVAPIATSAGASDAGKIAATGSDGRFDITLMPVGVGSDAFTVPAAEALSAGDFVSLIAVSGVVKAHLADWSNGRRAAGFVTSAVTVNGTATVYPLGETNSALSALTPGSHYWLDANGAVRATSGVGDPDNAGYLCQRLGVALSATELLTSSQFVLKL
jgi:hypothetical protein